jgi:hypothetical protein
LSCPALSTSTTTHPNFRIFSPVLRSRPPSGALAPPALHERTSRPRLLSHRRSTTRRTPGIG